VSIWQIAAAIALALALVLLQYSLVLYLSTRFRLPLELRRKSIHIAAGFTLAGFSLLESVPASIALSALLCCAALALRKLPALRWSMAGILHGAARSPSLGDYYFPLGFSLASLIARGDATVIVPAMLILTFADAAAALVGTAYGRHLVSLLGSKKSYEGTLAFWAVTFAILLYVFWPQLGSNMFIAALVGAAFLLTAVELLCTRGTDNLLLPAVGAAIIQALGR
jgi:phytol kinase